ncbi:SPFH domain/Band 7 family protein [Marinobacterium halophilum]|uniref:SPFH domain/Band 7 family protein n=1 Tax=Marinobacterium halophilum TaxID=267374 RepID=A0A2P8ESU9_9GAMM|nr:SPFH domain-containing protein [Marinobacterium halophilum]PSL12522.1 SPFH domain/Band 7 family protein [Marinobacterium halophilum]
MDETATGQTYSLKKSWMPGGSLLAKILGGGVVAVILGYVLSQSFFYAEPGYIYHVRTVTGNEAVVTEIGYKFYPFGRYNSWKRAMTVQAVSGSSQDAITSEKDSDNASASLPPLSIMFLDQVDAHAEATVRFSIPSDEESFLKLAHEYRSPENLLRTALLPVFKETLQANASLMTAEEYYAGGRTEFNSEYENQMRSGIYLVKREEVRVRSSKMASGSANVALGTEQEEYGEDSKTIFVVQKVLDATGQPRRKQQRFTDYGITVVSALVTDIKPNQKFIERMQLKQKASADRAIAREQRVQEEEQRLLAIARGEREVAERQAMAKVEQIQKTTEAQTEKQLAITRAEKLKAEAQIQRETAEINLEKARIEAQTQRTLADAEAYQKQVILEADNALAQKLDAEIKIQQLWAAAYAKRQVPTNVFGAGGSDGAPVGNDYETKAFMQLLTLDAAKRLNYERDLVKD